MKPRPLTIRTQQFSVDLKPDYLPVEWPLSVVNQITYSRKYKRLTFEGRPSPRQLADLLAANGQQPYVRAIKGLYKRAEFETRWSLKDWLRGGGYLDRWHGQYKSKRYFALLRSQDSKGFVILCPTFLIKPVVVETCSYGDLHIKSAQVCRFCKCPVELRFHQKVHLKLHVCVRCWAALLTTVQEISSSLNDLLKVAVLKKLGGW